jgi:hypothetical protein
VPDRLRARPRGERGGPLRPIEEGERGVGERGRVATGTIIPVRPCSTRCGIPPARVVTTGVPAANASRMDPGKLSIREAFRYRSAASYSSGIRSGGTRPTKRTPRSPSAPASASSRARSLPSPATVSRASGWRAWMRANARSTVSTSYIGSRLRLARKTGRRGRRGRKRKRSASTPLAISRAAIPKRANTSTR